MAIRQARVNVTAAPTPLHDPDPDGVVLRLRNSGAVGCDLGAADVVSGGGYAFANGTAEGPIHVGPNEVLHAVCATATSTTVQVLQTGAR